MIYIGIGYLNANFHEVTFKNGDFSGKSVFFRIFENLNLLRSRFCKKFTHLIYYSSFVSQDFLTGPVLIKSYWNFANNLFFRFAIFAFFDFFLWGQSQNSGFQLQNKQKSKKANKNEKTSY